MAAPDVGTTLSGDPLKRWHQRTHLVFDHLWKHAKKGERKRARAEAYRWLARALGLGRETCHIRLFDEATCRTVIEISKAKLEWNREEARIRKRHGRRVGRA